MFLSFYHIWYRFIRCNIVSLLQSEKSVIDRTCHKESIKTFLIYHAWNSQMLRKVGLTHLSCLILRAIQVLNSAINEISRVVKEITSIFSNRERSECSIAILRCSRYTAWQSHYRIRCYSIRSTHSVPMYERDIWNRWPSRMCYSPINARVYRSS